MRTFDHFLFENFDADREANNPGNPRRLRGEQVDALLSAVADCPSFRYDEACFRFGKALVCRLIEGGLLRQDNDILLFDSPVFLREDASVLHRQVAAKAAALADRLTAALPDITARCSSIRNGFHVQDNLYHILCGMVFDGSFFDSLTRCGALAVSRQHASGLDYLAVLYEQCGELHSLSDGLLCSYNRFVNANCALQTFGDADGQRFDLYRFFRLMEGGALPDKFSHARQLLGCLPLPDKDFILTEAAALVHTGRCDSAVLALLEHFGYAKNGAACVPVFTPTHQEAIDCISDLVDDCLGDAVAQALLNLAEIVDVTAVRHGVNPLETANELYHILFGSINEELITRGIVAAPLHIPGEGRYLRSIQLYE